jgi:lipopolysaccharide/colanic/teichoic acid biosynthesis glycosyltransferase
MIRFLDVVLSFTALVVLIPFFILIGIWIKLDSNGGVFYIQRRVGQYGRDFNLFKFRSMLLDSDQIGLLTIGERDPRITNSGYFIRKYKIDELPQLWNVLLGDMSFVGPRPEVRKYVELYDERQLEVLRVKPGITDEASIAFRKENDLLSKSSNPEYTYILEIMPAKIQLNMRFIKYPSIWNYFRIIFKTIFLYL